MVAYDDDEPSKESIESELCVVIIIFMPKLRQIYTLNLDFEITKAHRIDGIVLVHLYFSFFLIK